ncbi:MAG TPA: CpsB/CapC family capsule biosynthesis tyrosine phosphatase [Acidobacteriaceae bacterium]|jgi:protein-tyrosine phosphatase|nr:CpsB/CapC family capsule biosynthesis tyrosine phosphatase [Acidobacteriaceae bacterium]
MIDIHHHLLFDTDDGPADLDGAVAQAEAAAGDGITHIVCTPHANNMWEFNPTRNRERLAAIRDRIDGRLTLGLGCDFHLSPENIAEALEKPAKFTINQGRYLLVEFADFAISENIGDTFYEFALRGIRPIITHPERNPILQKRPERIAEWLRGNCLVQVTAGSLEGRFGKQPQAMAWGLLRRHWVHFIATDAHNLERRPPRLRAVCQAVAKRFGEETAHRLCVDNPRAAFDDRPLGEQPEPKGVFPDTRPAPRRGLVSWFFGN